MYRDELGTRMKVYYEKIPQTKLMRRTPVAIRIDGKSHHTYTRGFVKPFDSVYVKTMQDTMQYLCANIQGCVLGYTQSDEITLILVDYKKLESQGWFDYEVQKMCSISASMATMAFNDFFIANATAWLVNNLHEEDKPKLYEAYMKSLNNAMFDSRVFNIPKEEVTNLLLWRQLDASRNSIQMVGRAYFSHKQLDKKKCSQIQDMLMEEHNVNWNDYPTHLKRGSCCIKTNQGWVIDKDIPIFKGEGRDYVEKLIHFDDEIE